jgi:hypothetical protein
MSAARTSLSLAALVALTACGGGGGSGPKPVNTADLNPSLTSSTTPAALPNATKLVAAAYTNTAGSFSTTVGSTTYTYNLSSGDTVTLTGTTLANYNAFDRGFLMLCNKSAPSKAAAVIASPYLVSATPAKPEELVGKSFESVDGCAYDGSLPPLDYNSDGTVTATNGATTATVFTKAEFAKYVSDIGLKDGNDVYRGHIYKLTYLDGVVTRTAHVIIETFREDNQDGIAMYVESN